MIFQFSVQEKSINMVKSAGDTGANFELRAKSQLYACVTHIHKLARL